VVKFRAGVKKMSNESSYNTSIIFPLCTIRPILVVNKPTHSHWSIKIKDLGSNTKVPIGGLEPFLSLLSQLIESKADEFPELACVNSPYYQQITELLATEPYRRATRTVYAKLSKDDHILGAIRLALEDFRKYCR
jgi:hypothetical protein